MSEDGGLLRLEDANDELIKLFPFGFVRSSRLSHSWVRRLSTCIGNADCFFRYIPYFSECKPLRDMLIKDILHVSFKY